MINFFINLSPWIAASFAISAALTWEIPKRPKEFLKTGSYSFHCAHSILESLLNGRILMMIKLK